MSTLGGKVRQRRATLLLGTALALAPTAAAFAAENELETIVVTAQKREQNLQDVPVAVTALTAARLDDMGYKNVSDLTAIAPGLSVTAGPGGALNPSFTMRGVLGTGSFGSDPGVALYEDGLYIASTIGMAFDLADVERIEVLRGPQGTLFGRNAIGGAISIITKEPSGTFRARQKVSVGNLGQFVSKTSIDLPQWGLLSASVTFLHDEADGDIKNLGAGTVWRYGAATRGEYGDRVSPATLGAHDTNAVNAAVKLETDGGIKAVYRFSYSHKRYTPAGSAPETFNTGSFFGGIFQAAYLNQPAALRSPITATRPDATNNWYTTRGTQWFKTHSLTVTAPLTDSISVKNITGYRRNHMDTTNELSGLGGLLTSYVNPASAPAFFPLGFLLGLNGGPPGTPLLLLDNNTVSDQETVSNELQFNIDTNRLKSTVGYLYYHAKNAEGGFPGVINTAPLSGILSAPYIGFAPPVIVGSLPQPAHVTTISHAVYTQNEIHVTDKLDVVGGVRYTKDTRRGFDGSPAPAAPPTLIDYSKGTWTYLAGLNYQATDDIFTYVHYSTAYISGGQIANVTFEPETAKSLEVGVKADLFDNVLRLNAALYTVKYDNVQVQTDPNTGCQFKPGVARTASLCVANGGDVRTKGFEVEATYVTPVRGLTLSGSLGYTHNRYTRIDPILAVPGSEFRFHYNPEWTGNMAASYRGPDMDGLRGAHVVARIETNYTSRTSARLSLAPGVTEGLYIPEKWITNARLGLSGIQVGETEIDIAAFAKNLTDNKSKTFSLPLPFFITNQFQRAREYGVEVSAAF
jgi:iron complex outermembrane receptor protein